MPPPIKPQTASSLLALHGVSKAFPNGTLALANLNFDVRTGEFLSLLGPSGCGKSTALRIIAGLSPPSQGSVDWPAHDTAADRASRIGFVFQEPTLMPWASVFDNAALPLVLKGISAESIAKCVSGALDRVGLAKFAHVYPRELSGGMKMRVSIARALVTEPQLLLLDEPFAALDEITRFRLNEDLLRLWSRHGWTVVFVTHSVFESVFLSNRIIVMTKRPGRVAAEVAIDLPYPREGALRTAPEYSAECRKLSQLLAKASA